MPAGGEMMRTKIRAKIVDAASAMRVLTVGIMLCVGLAICGQNQPANMDKLPAPSDKVNAIVNWGERISTRGAKLEIREAKRGEKDGKLLIAYDFYVTGAPRGQSYTLFQYPITVPEPAVLLREVSFDAMGRLCVKKGKECSQPVQINFLPEKAEPFRFLLLSMNGKTSIAALIVPNPIIGTDQGCSVEAVRVTPNFDVALLRGKGFKPGEEPAYESNSAGEQLHGTVKIDKAGEFTLVLSPAVAGKVEGSDTVTVKSALCNPSVAFNWRSVN
jgi:hypothetical protein